MAGKPPACNPRSQPGSEEPARPHGKLTPLLSYSLHLPENGAANVFPYGRMNPRPQVPFCHTVECSSQLSYRRQTAPDSPPPARICADGRSPTCSTARDASLRHEWHKTPNEPPPAVANDHEWSSLRPRSARDNAAASCRYARHRSAQSANTPRCRRRTPCTPSTCRKMGRPTGFEPATPRSTILCSNQLSYGRRIGGRKIDSRRSGVNPYFRQKDQATPAVHPRSILPYGRMR